MWILTTRGFFSAVAKDGPDTIVVRARARADLENLLPLLGNGATIETGGGTDYAFRVRVSHDTWKGALAELASEIDYGNFKNAVADRQGRERADVYGKIWLALQRLERSAT